MSDWKEPDTAPKDGSVFIADIRGFLDPVACMFNEYEHKYIVASSALNMVDERNDPYFESEYFDLNDLVKWRKL